MNPISLGLPSVVKTGEVSFSNIGVGENAKTVASMQISLSDGREFTFSNEYAKGVDQKEIASDMMETMQKTIHIPILHGLGDPNRKNPTSSISLMADGSIVKNYAQSGKNSKTISNYAEYIQSKSERYVKRLEDSDIDTVKELQKRLEAIRQIQKNFI